MKFGPLHFLLIVAIIIKVSITNCLNLISSYRQALFVGLILLNRACNFKSPDSPDYPSLNCTTRKKLRDSEIEPLKTVQNAVMLRLSQSSKIVRGRSDKAQDARLDIHASGFLEQKRSVLFDVRVCHKNAESFRDLKPQQYYQIICIEHLHHQSSPQRRNGKEMLEEVPQSISRADYHRETNSGS